MRYQIGKFAEAFSALHIRSVEIIKNTPDEWLFRQPLRQLQSDLFPTNSVGEMILRSAGRVEQTFGGITVRLWDDPFEWTLPESFGGKSEIYEYLNEVQITAEKGFGYLHSDADLQREIPAPEKLKTIFAVLLETLAAAENLNGRAASILQIVALATKPKM